MQQAGRLGKLTIVSDLPLEGSLRTLSVEIQQAAALVLKTAGGKAGKFTVQLVNCDDATAQAASWDSATCTANANGYARNRGRRYWARSTPAAR